MVEGTKKMWLNVFSNQLIGIALGNGLNLRYTSDFLEALRILEETATHN